MHTFLNYDLSKFRNNLPNIVIRNSIRIDGIFDIFYFPDFFAPDISKTNKVKNLNQAPKVAQIIIHM